MEDTSRISPEKLRNFFRHICIVTKKYKKREQAKINLKKQIHKIKKASRSPKKGRLEKEIKKLEEKISEVLDAEAKLLRIEKKESSTVKELIRKVRSIEKGLVATKRRAGKLEKRIRARVKPTNKPLMLKIQKLEARRKALMRKSKNKEELVRIKERLNAVKKAL